MLQLLGEADYSAKINMEDNIMSTENIRNLEAKTLAVFTELRFSEHSIRHMLVMARTLIRLHLEQGEEFFNRDIAEKYVKHQENRHRNREISKNTLSMYRSEVAHLIQIGATGTIAHKQGRQLLDLPDYFCQVLSDILANEEWSPKHRKHQYGHAQTFFRWLHLHGYDDLSCVDTQIVREYLIDCSARMVGYSLDNSRRALKKLFLFLSKDGDLSEEMSKLFLFRVPIERKIKPFMPQDEIAAVLNSINRSTARGKRDYAVILLAAVTGLRGIDIVELSLNSICWRSGEIKIIQEKTGNTLALPLTTDVGEAIGEYIMNARPQSESNHVFLSTRVPFGAMYRRTPNKILKAYCAKAGLSQQRSFHSLRRGVATSMVTSGVSVITVAQTLGHKTINPTKQYISLDSQNLKECALDLSGIQTGGAGL
jgi:site-specific recombinase XerD